MTLENLKSIDDAFFPVVNLISMISKEQNAYLNHRLEEFEITATQLHLLFEISCQCDINQEKIASRCNINKGSVARSIRKLEEKEIIARKIDDENRRQNKVSLTQKGEEILDKSIKILNDWEEEILKDNAFKKDELKKALMEILIKTIELNDKGDN